MSARTLLRLLAGHAVAELSELLLEDAVRLVPVGVDAIHVAIDQRRVGGPVVL